MSIVLTGRDAEATDVDFAILGSFQVKVAGQWQVAPTRQAARVATLLCGWPGEPVEIDRIIAGLWGENPPATVTNTLQVHVSHLRSLVGRDRIRFGVGMYVLDIPEAAVDVHSMEELIHDSARMMRRQHYGRAAELLSRAVRLWRGTPFPDVLDPDLEARRARLSELRDQAREDLLECRLELCHDRMELAQVVAEAKELVARQPWRERGHVLLVRALAASERLGEASAAFEAASTLLRDSFGLDPGRELVEVHTRALLHEQSLLPRVMRSITLLPPNIPTTPEEAGLVQQAREAVLDLGARLVTIVEPDEDAARRISTAIGHALVDDLPTGVLLIEESSATLGSLAKAVAEASGQETISELDDLDNLAGLAVVVNGTGPTVAAMVAAMKRCRVQPVLVVVGDVTLGLKTEVVIESAALKRRALRVVAHRRDA